MHGEIAYRQLVLSDKSGDERLRVPLLTPVNDLLGGDANRTEYVIYLSSREHERRSRAVFGNCEWPMTFYIAHGHGGFARICRKLPLPKLWGVLSRECRMGFLVQRKQATS